MSNLVKISAAAPTPLMVPAAASRFEKLRELVHANSGVDFLAVCGDVCRPAEFVSSKDGVANRSWHKTGRAFDYDQTNRAIVIVSEPSAGKQFFRTWLHCGDQSGQQGVKRSLLDMRGNTVNAYVFDFTAAAQTVGFMRIPAWSGWQQHYNRREFWHYQYNPDDLTWDQAMAEVKGERIKDKGESSEKTEIVGLNDRGPRVTEIQTALNAAGLLPAAEIDGVFGNHTKNAVVAFQRKHNLLPDGLVGPDTLAKLKG